MKMALVSPHRIIGVNVGLGHEGKTSPAGDWKKLRESGPGTDDYALSMLLEPMYMLMGRHVPSETTRRTTSRHAPRTRRSVAIFTSEPLTEDEGRLVGRRVRGDRLPREEG